MDGRKNARIERERIESSTSALSCGLRKHLVCVVKKGVSRIQRGLLHLRSEVVVSRGRGPKARRQAARLPGWLFG